MDACRADPSRWPVDPNKTPKSKNLRSPHRDLLLLAALHNDIDVYEDLQASPELINKAKTVDKAAFETNPDGSVVVYTDGACSKNGYVGSKAGIGVYFGPDNPL